MVFFFEGTVVFLPALEVVLFLPAIFFELAVDLGLALLVGFGLLLLVDAFLFYVVDLGLLLFVGFLLVEFFFYSTPASVSASVSRPVSGKSEPLASSAFPSVSPTSSSVPIVARTLGKK